MPAGTLGPLGDAATESLNLASLDPPQQTEIDQLMAMLAKATPGPGVQLGRGFAA